MYVYIYIYIYIYIHIYVSYIINSISIFQLLKPTLYMFFYFKNVLYTFIYIYIYILAVSPPLAGLLLVPVGGLYGAFGPIKFWGLWPLTCIYLPRFAWQS